MQGGVAIGRGGFQTGETFAIWWCCSEGSSGPGNTRCRDWRVGGRWSFCSQSPLPGLGLPRTGLGPSGAGMGPFEGAGGWEGRRHECGGCLTSPESRGPLLMASGRGEPGGRRC